MWTIKQNDFTFWATLYFHVVCIVGRKESDYEVQRLAAHGKYVKYNFHLSPCLLQWKYWQHLVAITWLRVPERMQFRLCVLAYLCTAQHRHTCPTASGRHQISSLVAVSALLTPRHCRCRRLVGLPCATAPFRWLQGVHGTICHLRLGPAPHFCHITGRPSLTILVSHTADLALSIQTASRRLHWTVQQFCK